MRINYILYYRIIGLYYRIFAAFQVDIDTDKSNVENKTTTIYNQNPVLIGYLIISELDDVLKDGFFESNTGYKKINWFVDQVKKLENEMALKTVQNLIAKH